MQDIANFISIIEELCKLLYVNREEFNENCVINYEEANSALNSIAVRSVCKNHENITHSILELIYRKNHKEITILGNNMNALKEITLGSLGNLKYIFFLFICCWILEFFYFEVVKQFLMRLFFNMFI